MCHFFSTSTSQIQNLKALSFWWNGRCAGFLVVNECMCKSRPSSGIPRVLFTAALQAKWMLDSLESCSTPSPPLLLLPYSGTCARARVRILRNAVGFLFRQSHKKAHPCGTEEIGP